MENEAAAADGKTKKPEPRVPTFLVIDEAHNVASFEPANTTARGIRDQVRTIAAEGRKYGVFLILCTQRPDKIDSLVTSECQNRLLMKLGSQAVLNRAGELGLDPQDHADCLAFKLGNGTLIGKWGADKGVRFLGGIRRTQEGGGEISKDWQLPP